MRRNILTNDRFFLTVRGQKLSLKNVSFWGWDLGSAVEALARDRLV